MDDVNMDALSTDESMGSLITGIPAPIRKSFLRVIANLSTAIFDLPLAVLQGKADEIRATNEARVRLIQKSASNFVDGAETPQEYIDKASIKYAAKIAREQVNLDSIALYAANELRSAHTSESDSKEPPDVSVDWLNEFESLGRLKSSDEMRVAFGKILSGEILNPGSFSIKTLRLISQLDNSAAKLFQRFCSLAVSLRTNTQIIDGRVISLSGHAATNSLMKYGLSFNELNLLQEYGLIIADYNSYMPYKACVVDEQDHIQAYCYYQNVKYAFVPIDRPWIDTDLTLYGVSLTNAGKELMDIVPVESNQVYWEDLQAYFRKKRLSMVALP